MNKRFFQSPTRATRRRLRFARNVAALVLAAASTSFVFFAVSERSRSAEPTANASSSNSAPTGTFAAAPPKSSNEKTTFWLTESNGDWKVPLPNWTLEEVMKTIDANREEANESPYSIQSVEAFGQVDEDAVLGGDRGGVARLTIQLEIYVDDGIVRVPLGLGEGVYIPQAGETDYSGFQYEGPGFCALDVDPVDGRYVALIRTENGRNPFQDGAATGASPTDGAETANDAPVARESVPATDQNTPESVAEPTDAGAEKISPDETSENAAPTSEEPSQSGEPNAPENAPSKETSPSETPETSETPGDATTLRTREPAAAYSQNAAPSDVAPRPRPNRYLLTLQLCFVVESIGADEYRFKATFPPSSRSQLTLDASVTTSKSDVKIDVVRGAVAATTTAMSESKSELRLHGLGRGGETTEFVWRRAEPRGVGNQLVNRVEDATIDVRLDALETLYDATLPIRTLGGEETDVFKIVLPEGASLVSNSVVATDANDAALELASVREITPEDPQNASAPTESKDEANGESKTVEIRLAQKTATVVLKLKANAKAPENSTDAGGLPDKTRRLSGFAVADAIKQFGQIKIAKAEELDFDVEPEYGARSDADKIDSESGKEVYSFFAQPFLLLARPFVRKSVVNVKPEFQTTIDESTATLRARFQYSVYGTRIKAFKIRLNGWIFSGASEDVVDVNGIVADETTGETIFQLKTPASGAVAFELTASRELDKTEDGAFEFPTPVPIADLVDSAPLVVVPADSVELTPTPENFAALSSKPVRTLALDLETPKSQQPPVSYLAEFPQGNKLDAPTFAARVQKRPQEVEVDAKTEITLSDSGTKQIRQTFTYRIAWEPLDSIAIQTPVKLLEESTPPRASNLKFFVDGRQISPNALSVETEDDKNALRRILLSEPKIGACVVAIQYDDETVAFQKEMTARIEFSLMQPLDGTLKTNELTIRSPLEVDVKYVENSSNFWKLQSSELATDGRSTYERYASTLRETTATFSGAFASASGVRDVVVDRAWIQSWVSDKLRVDRAAYRISRCDDDRLKIKLPDGVRRDRVSVALDGVPVARSSDDNPNLFDDEGRLEVLIPSDKARSKEFTLELDYSVDGGEFRSSRWTARFPEFIGDSIWIRRSYWQLLTPFNRHVVVDPRNWTPEYVVTWKGRFGFYGRSESTTQEELCDWIGIERRERIPEDVNSYLYGAFDGPSSASVRVADRALLILFGSGAALAFGLGLLYFPIVRSRGALFVAGVVALALATYRPTLAFLFLQTTVFGIALTLATAIFANWLGRRDGGAARGETRQDARDKIRAKPKAKSDDAKRDGLRAGIARKVASVPGATTAEDASPERRSERRRVAEIVVGANDNGVKKS